MEWTFQLKASWYGASDCECGDFVYSLNRILKSFKLIFAMHLFKTHAIRIYYTGLLHTKKT